VRHCRRCRCFDRLSYKREHDDTMKCATCNMPHANVNAFVVAFVAVAVAVLHLLQTLILFMLHCSEVNNFIYQLPVARSIPIPHSQLELQLPLQSLLKLLLLMTHDTCFNFFVFSVALHDLLKPMASHTQSCQQKEHKFDRQTVRQSTTKPNEFHINIFAYLSILSR